MWLLQHLNGESHSWGEMIVKSPKGDFSDFSYALTQRAYHNWDEIYDVQLMHLFLEGCMY